jgi:ubiquinone/menaquinone biosynthesis C-methylase UbiE
MADAPGEWLERVYGARDPGELDRAYDAWAGTYDVDVMSLGYLNTAVVTAMTARHVGRQAGEILDVGAGTGIIGEVLAALGYAPLAAIDLSDGMLAVARAKGVYGELYNMELGRPLDFADDRFAATVGSGVFTVGHAPAAAYDELARVTRPGGHVVVAVTDKAQAELGFGERQATLARDGRWRLADVTGPYLVMPNAPEFARLSARVYVLEVLA